MGELAFEVNGDRFPLRLEVQDGSYQVVLGGRTYHVTVQRHGAGELDLLVDGQPQRFYIANSVDDPEQRLIWHQGQLWRVNAIDVQSRRKPKRSEQSDTTLSATMPGVVRAILVNVGDRVVAGDPLLILEAMKMENELRSMRAGVVKEVTVAPGQRVDQNAVLLILE